MRTSAAGNSRRRPAGAGGFTLLELLVVLAIMALATVGVSLSLPDPARTQLEREAQRLAALFEAARAQSRASGVMVRWIPTSSGFRFEGVPDGTLPSRWLASDIRGSSAAPVVLGPEPLIGPQAVELVHTDRAGLSLRVVTDGLRPFAVTGQTP